MPRNALNKLKDLSPATIGMGFAWVGVMIYAASNSIATLLVGIGSANPVAGGRNAITFTNLLFLGSLISLVPIIALFPGDWTRTNLRALSRKDWGFLTLSAFLSSALTPGLFFFALEHSSVTNVVLVSRIEPPLFLLAAAIFLRELLAGIAHELNNPLSIIAGNAEILHEELENPPQERRVEKLSQAAQRCIRIVRSFLSLAREEPLDLKPLRISELVLNAVEAATQEAEKAIVTLRIDHTQPCAEVIADEVQLTQVLINLLTNGVHAIRDSGVGDQVSIGWTCTGKTLSLRVADNGPGVPDDLTSRIFDPLFTTKQAGKGTGVGLAYCHRIITAHKGQIHLETGKARGAAFVFELPLAR